ncbi:hypothetical protein BG004_000473, partial [Podila humilis]
MLKIPASTSFESLSSPSLPSPNLPSPKAPSPKAPSPLPINIKSPRYVSQDLDQGERHICRELNAKNTLALTSAPRGNNAPSNSSSSSNGIQGSIFSNLNAFSMPRCSHILLGSPSPSVSLFVAESPPSPPTIPSNMSDIGLPVSAAIQKEIAGAGGNVSTTCRISAHRAPGSPFRMIRSLLAATSSLPSQNSKREILGIKSLHEGPALLPSWSSDDLLSPEYTRKSSAELPNVNAEPERHEPNPTIEVHSFPASTKCSPYMSPKAVSDVLVLDVERSLSLRTLKRTQQQDEHSGYRMDTPLLDLQEQGYAMLASGKVIVPRKFEERMFALAEPVKSISLNDAIHASDDSFASTSSKSLPRGYLVADGDHMEAERQTVSRNNDEQLSNGCHQTLEGIEQGSEPSVGSQGIKSVRFDPDIHIITTIMRTAMEDDAVLSANACGTQRVSPAAESTLNVARRVPLPDSPAMLAKPEFKLNNLEPAFQGLGSIDASISRAFGISELPSLPPSPVGESIKILSDKSKVKSEHGVGCSQDDEPHLHRPKHTPNSPAALKTLQLDIAKSGHVGHLHGVAPTHLTVKRFACSILSPISPRAAELLATRHQLQYWTETVVKLRDQEQQLTSRIDTLISEIAHLIDRCEASEIGLQETEAELQEVQIRLAE